MTLPIHHITLTVSNSAASAKWFQDLLGSARVTQRELNGFSRTVMGWPNGLIIGLSQYPDAGIGEKFSHFNYGLDHFGLTCGSHEEVLNWKRKLEELGYEHGPVDDSKIWWAVTARTPDNIPVEFFCLKPPV